MGHLWITVANEGRLFNTVLREASSKFSLLIMQIESISDRWKLKHPTLHQSCCVAVNIPVPARHCARPRSVNVLNHMENGTCLVRGTELAQLPTGGIRFRRLPCRLRVARAVREAALAP